MVKVRLILVILGLFLIYSALFKFYLGPAAREEARTEEAGATLSFISQACKDFYAKDKSTQRCIEENLGIGKNFSGPAAGDCSKKQYFWYYVQEHKDARGEFIATRCLEGGKEPQGRKPRKVILKVDYSTGKENWSEKAR
ncbi:MAG: hypothetical protein PHG40_05230 [Candidatus Omnitrophica bacterium]|nr:hypothetical protein [Candidatus Omnitrophota bacterium]